VGRARAGRAELEIAGGEVEREGLGCGEVERGELERGKVERGESRAQGGRTQGRLKAGISMVGSF
jgi:hypothetical protein